MMSSKRMHCFLYLVLGVALACAQETKPTPRPEPQRFAKALGSLANEEPEKGGIVFTGSSSIARWKSLKKDFPDLPVVNQGFGGSVANDLTAYIDTVVLRHEPRLLVIYTGSNDINAKLTVDEAFADYIGFIERVHEKLPQCRVLINSVKIAISRAAQIPQVLELNRRLEEWARDKEWARYLDTSAYLADERGQPIRKYYVNDLLHLSPAGYEEWIKVLEPVLREEWAKALRDTQTVRPVTVAAPPQRADPARYAKNIAAFGAEEPVKQGMVFIGSSGTTRWKSLAEDFPDLPVVNRAFGGSRINDLIVYFDAIALRHEPRMVVIDIGGNDLAAGLSVDETFAEYLRLLDLVHTQLPRARVVINSLGIGMREKRVKQIPRVIEMNGRLARWARAHDWARFVDRTSYQLGPKGELNREHYVDDLLHPSRAGYEEWIKVLGPTLREEWSKVSAPTKL